MSHIQQRATAILASQLGLDPKATVGFAMALSEACQNIVEHAGTGGWVAVQRYEWKRRLSKKVVVIAVGDAGVGFRHTLEPTQAKRFGDRWGDGAALEAALIQGTSRFRDPGRGQGLKGIRGYLSRWDGKIAIRSGTARIAIAPSWDDDAPLTEGLSAFPGSQVLLIIPGAGDRHIVIAPIDVHAVLQASVPGPYADLVTRPTGRAVRERIERTIADAPVASMDFTGVRCIDYSCADEIVAKLLRTVQILLLQGITDAHRLAIEPGPAGSWSWRWSSRPGCSSKCWARPEAAEVVCERLLERRLAERTAGGTLALTAA